jgi:hypothetical protein
MFGLAVAMTGLGVVALYIFGPKSKRLWRCGGVFLACLDLSESRNPASF